MYTERSGGVHRRLGRLPSTQRSVADFSNTPPRICGRSAGRVGQLLAWHTERGPLLQRLEAELNLQLQCGLGPDAVVIMLLRIKITMLFANVTSVVIHAALRDFLHRSVLSVVVGKAGR